MNKTWKKAISGILSLTLLFSCGVGVVNANESERLNDELVSVGIENYIELHNQDAKDLFERAKVENFKQEGKTEAINPTNNLNIGAKTETYSFEDVVLSLGDEEVKARTTVSKISGAPIADSVNPIKPGVGTMDGWEFREDYDSSYSVYAASTVYYYNKTAYDGARMYRMYRVDVSNRVEDSSVSIQSQKLVYGQAGSSEYELAVQDRAVKYPSGRGGTYYTGFNEYVRDWWGTVGATYTLTLTRRSSYTWTLEIVNTAY